MTLLQWEARVPKTDIWNGILTWVKCEREKLGEKRNRGYKLKLLKRNLRQLESFDYWVPFDLRRFKLEQEIKAVEREIQGLEQETQVLDWIRQSGKEALKRVENVLDSRDKATHVGQHIEQLLWLMEQEYWDTQPQTSWIRDPDLSMSVSSRKEIFRKMINEIPELIVHRKFGLRNSTLEARFSTTLDKILRLSSWTPSSTHNEHLRELLRNALLMLNDLGDNEEYHDYLRDFMTRHAALCAFTLDNADDITTGDSETTAELCKNLRRLAQNLGKIASTKAEHYQKLYENFIAHREELSHWLDSASLGQGKFYI